MPIRIQRALLLLAMLSCAALVTVAAWRARGHRISTSDFDDFHLSVTADLLARGTITTGHGVHNYLPFFVVLMTPFGLLPMSVGCAVFVALSLALFGFSTVLIDRYMVPLPAGPSWLRAGMPIIMIAPFVVSAAVLGQVGLLVLFLVMLCWYLVESQRPFSAGLTLSLAMLIKVFPAVLCLYFLLKRQWRLLGGAATGTLLFGGLLTTAVFGPAENFRLHQEYWDRAVAGHGPLAELVKTKHVKSTSQNQSLPIVLRRLLTDIPAIHHQDQYRFVNVARLPDEYVNFAGVTLKPLQIVYLSVALSLVAWMCWVARHSMRRTPPDRARLEFAAFSLLCLVLSPLLWVHYLVICYYALALFTAELMKRVEGGQRALVSRAVWFAWLGSLPLLGSDYCRAVGVHLWCVAAVMLVMVAWAWRRPLQSRGREAVKMNHGTTT